MTKRIFISNQNGNEIISFTNFNLEYDYVLKRITFQITVNDDVFKATTTVQAEEHDFINLKYCLLGMYNNKFKSCVFNPIDNVLEITFSLQETGVIEVDMQLSNIDFTSNLSIKFNTDLTFLPTIINSIEELVTR